MKKQILLLGILATLLSACDRDFDGQISLTQNLAVRQKKSVVVLPAGSYGLRLAVEDKNEIVLKLITGPKQAIKVKIKSANSMNLPKNGGDTVIAGRDTGQSFDILAHVDYQVDRSPEMFRVESCSQTIQRRICTIQPDHSESCVDRNETVSGRQEVRYYNRTETRIISGEIVNSADQAHLADLQGSNYSTSEVITGRSFCSAGGLGWGDGAISGSISSGSLN